MGLETEIDTVRMINNIDGDYNNDGSIISVVLTVLVTAAATSTLSTIAGALNTPE